MNRLLLLLWVSLLAACAYPHLSTDFAPVPSVPSKATVYIYRNKSSVHSLNPDVPRFYVNDDFIGKLSLGGYYFRTVPAGEVEIFYKDTLFGIVPPWKSGKINFPVEAGKAYFVKYEVGFMNGLFGLVSNEDGEAEIKETKLLTY